MKQKNIRGFMALIIVIIIAIIATTAAVSVSLSGLGELAGNYMAHQSQNSFDNADACAEEALLRLRRDAGYIGGTMVLSAPCTIIINAAEPRPTPRARFS